MAGSQLPAELIGRIDDRIDLSAEFLLSLADCRHNVCKAYRTDHQDVNVAFPTFSSRAIEPNTIATSIWPASGPRAIANTPPAPTVFAIRFRSSLKTRALPVGLVINLMPSYASRQNARPTKQMQLLLDGSQPRTSCSSKLTHIHRLIRVAEQFGQHATPGLPEQHRRQTIQIAKCTHSRYNCT